MKNIIWGLLLTLTGSSVILTSCEMSGTNDLPGDPVNIITEVYQKQVIDSANRFAFDLFKPVIADGKGTENIMISPYSITSALSMTLNGAAGETFEAIRKTLRLEDKILQQINETYLKLMTEMVPVDKRVLVEIANSVWVEKHVTVKQSFITALQTWYKAESRNIDVTDADAVDIVNGWIAEKTHDKITDMLDYLDPQLAMLLINAIYFNGKWRYQFDKDDTYDEPFYVTASTPKDVPMMHQTENLKVARTNNLIIVELPYGQGNFTMVVVLPDENVTTVEVAEALTPSVWQDWMDMLSGNTQEVDLTLPRFKYMYKRLLNDDLIDLGMGVAFSAQANFSNISDQGLMINRVLHQAFIETNEEGTEAAAATIVEFKDTASPFTNEVKINHPFLYFIRETSTGTILFMGRVGDPTLN
ncbi:MAG: serpin family protein [Bacteroidales bacterium]|nr:serpin family protein [Bacteroidales bacterium]